MYKRLGQLWQETFGNAKFYMPSMESYSATNIKVAGLLGLQ
jgi:hypothetical protein